MNSKSLEVLTSDIAAISQNFEEEPWTDNVKLLRDSSKASDLELPRHYSDVLRELEEIQRQIRVLFLRSVFERVCLVEGEAYAFKSPFQAGMRYDAVMKKDNAFFLVDEDGTWREIFSSEKFARFVDDEYWQLIDGESSG